MTRPLEVVRLGRRPYEEVREIQLEAVARRAAGEIGDRLYLVEHDSVVTVGRGADPSAVAGVPFPVVHVERGGEATWHGPGQLVGYPILALEEGERDLHRYLRDLEEALIRALSDVGLAATRSPPHTGVWCGTKKLASIGVAVRRWVTYHGFALNVDCDLTAFRSFAPCGLDATVMSSVAEMTGSAVEASRIEDSVVSRLCEVLGRRPV